MNRTKCESALTILKTFMHGHTHMVIFLDLKEHND